MQKKKKKKNQQTGFRQYEKNRLSAMSKTSLPRRNATNKRIKEIRKNVLTSEIHVVNEQQQH